MKIAVFAPDGMLAHFYAAIEREGFEVLDHSELEPCDEWQTKRWFAENMPDLVLMGLEGVDPQTARELLVAVQGGINIINSAIGFSRHLRLYGWFASNAFFSLRRLCLLHAREKEVDFDAKMVSGGRELAEQVVLVIRDVAAEETNPEGPEGAQQGREVRDQVVPESQGRQQHGPDAESVLEMPLEAAQGQAPGDVCPECDEGPRPAA